MLKDKALQHILVMSSVRTHVLFQHNFTIFN